MTEQPLSKDWAFFRAAVESLQDYLLSSELYWPLFVHPREKVTGNLLQLTLGNLRLTEARLQGYPWPDKQLGELSEARSKISQIHEKWKTAWNNKAMREIPARLALWQNYVDELCDQPQAKAANYPFQVRWRAVLDLLRNDLTGKAEIDLGRLIEMDMRLKKISHSAGFVWEAEIAPAFPKETFWYLYLAVQGC